MTGGGALTATDIEVGLEERWTLTGHDIRITKVDTIGGVLHCNNCDIHVAWTMNHLGGWHLSNWKLDKPCIPA